MSYDQIAKCTDLKYRNDYCESYVRKAQDLLGSVARSFGLSVDCNKLERDVTRAGDEPGITYTEHIAMCRLIEGK